MLSNKNQETTLPTDIQHDSWEQRAELAQAALISQFWNSENNMFDNITPRNELCNERFHYWWQAHAVDALVDGLDRTGDAKYSEYLACLYQGLLDRNGGVWLNELYDDMEWMAISWLRAYKSTNEVKYKMAALTLWEDIKGGWNDEQGGGIAWQKSQLDYKNTPANAPAVILAARLYQEFGNAEDLVWAKQIYEWQKHNLVDPESGFVWDGMNREGDGRIDKNWEFTYCQGVYIGAGVELFRCTRDKSYLQDASQTLHAASMKLANPVTGILPSEGPGDAGLFKGIMIRYIGELIAEDSSQVEGIQLLKVNSVSLWDSARDTKRQIFNESWISEPESAIELSTDLSGVMLVEQMARLEKKGLLT